MSNVEIDFAAQMRGEFIDEARDILNQFDVVLSNMRSGQEQTVEGFRQLRMYAHNLKGSSGVAGFPLVQVVMHRLEDYIETIDNPADKTWDDIVVYTDKARALLSGELEDLSAADLVRQLPQAQASFEVSDVALPNPIEVLMVIKEKVAGKLFERELRSCGMRVTIVQSSFEAIEMVARTKPEYVLVSGVLDELSGIDLVSAFSVMPTTAKIPVSLLTSMDANSPEMKSVPEQVSVIHKNHFADDLAKALRQHKFL